MNTEHLPCCLFSSDETMARDDVEMETNSSDSDEEENEGDSDEEVKVQFIFSLQLITWEI